MDDNRLTMIISNQIELPIQDVPSQTLAAIYDELTLYNPKHEAAIKQGRSTYNIPEYIKLYRKEQGKLILPRGCGKWLQDLLVRKQISFTPVDNRLTLDTVQFELKITLRGYQQKAVDALLDALQGGLVSPCGSGKTNMALALIAKIEQPALVIVHTKELADQFKTRATQVLDMTEDEIGYIGGGKFKIGERLTIALVQTLAKRDLSDIVQRFGCIVVDEAHHVPSETAFKVVNQFPAKFRYWLSATPERSDGLTPLLFAAGGPIAWTVSADDVPKVTPQLRVVETSYSGTDDDYTRLMASLVESQERNKLVVQTIVEEAKGHFSLVLSSRIEHLKTLAKMLRAKLPDMSIELLVGSMSKREREAVMERARNKEVDILLSNQIAKEGLDLPHLDRLFMVTPKRAASTVEQEVGRVMRPDTSKTGALVVDFLDNQNPILKSQFYGRRQVYEKLGMKKA